jgi:3-keto-disaccharide hydrolase
MRLNPILAVSFAVSLSISTAVTSTAVAEQAKTDAKPAKEAPVVPPREGKRETVKLFNGKNLEGWEGHDNLWSVKDGVIVGKNSEPVKVSTYLLTKRKFSDFRLVATVKLVESEMHSGIAMWGRNAPEHGDKYTYAGHLVMFPSAWGMYDLFGRNGLPVDGAPAKKVGHQHDWNKLEILAQGNRVRVVVNGTQVVDWRDPEPDRIKEGPIGLQLHANPMPQEVHCKDLELTTFPEDKLITVKE